MKSLVKLLCLCLINLPVMAQSVTILPDGITPASVGNIPSLSYDAIMALPLPSIGSLATDLTFKCLRFYNGTKWTRLLSNSDTNPAAITAWSEGVDTANEGGVDVAVDATGNIYVTGNFTGTTTIGTNTFVSEGNGNSDIFIAKYTKDGAFVWSKEGGGANSEATRNMVIDKNGDVYITGYFSGVSTFDDFTLTGNGSSDIFIIKYKPNGTIEWARKAGGNGSDAVNNLKTDSNGNIYITGHFESTAFFNNTSVTSAGEKDIFIAKYNSAGTLQWVQRAGGVNAEVAYDVAVDANEAVYITGQFIVNTSFGNISLTSDGIFDIFIARYNPSTATWGWAKKAGGTGYDIGRQIAVQSDGYLIVSGGFEGTANFSGNSLVSEGEADIYLARYNNSGSILWAKREGGKDTEYGSDMSLDAEDNIYLTGKFQGLCNMGSAFLPSNGSNDIFISKFSSSGSFRWAQKIGSIGDDYVYGLEVQPDGNVYITGSYGYTLDFGNFSMPNNGSSSNIFFARIRD